MIIVRKLRYSSVVEYLAICLPRMRSYIWVPAPHTIHTHVTAHINKYIYIWYICLYIYGWEGYVSTTCADIPLERKERNEMKFQYSSIGLILGFELIMINLTFVISEWVLYDYHICISMIRISQNVLNIT